MNEEGSGVRPRILLALSRNAWDNYVAEETLKELETFADWDWYECEGGGIESASEDEAVAQELTAKVSEFDGLVLCHGAPRVTAKMLDAAPRLRILGELEGDRFAARMDLAAAWERGVRTVDTTNGSSYPVSEWALGLILISLRNVGSQFRRMISGQPRVSTEPYGGVLTGKRVGLIGCGNMGRLLIKYLKPFDVDIWVYDPYLPREMADAVGFLQTSLSNVLSQCDVVVCVAPLTPVTRKMIGAREFALLKPGSAFVNVSRGAIVDSDALVERLKKGDITAGLEVFDPEPVPPDHEILTLDNVFLTPHSAAYRGAQRQPFLDLMVEELYRFFHGHETKFDLTSRVQANRTGGDSSQFRT